MKNEVIFSQLEKYADLLTWYYRELLKHESNTEAYQICHAQLMQLVNEADKLSDKLFSEKREKSDLPLLSKVSENPFSISTRNEHKVQNGDYSS
jgi:hypothetical protein